MRWAVGLFVAFSLLLAVPALADGADDDGLRVSGGKHIGDKEPLEYEIVYTRAFGTLTIDETGCTYYFPQWNWYWRPPCSYGEEYYGTYMVYFINSWMNYEVHLRNTGQRTYKHLEVTATQEYHEDICVWTGACVQKGDAMPGDPTRTWTLDSLGPGEEVVLRGAYYAPSETLPGLDQTHLVVKHGKGAENGKGMGAPGRVLIDDPEAGVYCPPEPVVAAGP